MLAMAMNAHANAFVLDIQTYVTTQNTQNNLHVRLVLERRPDTYDVPITLGPDKLAYDQNGKPWTLETPLLLTARADQPPRTQFPFQHVREYALAYERIEQVAECLSNAPEGGVECCSRADGVLKYTLTRNTSKVSVFNVMPGTRKLSFHVSVAQVGGSAARQAVVSLDKTVPLMEQLGAPGVGNETATVSLVVVNGTGHEHLTLDHLPSTPYYAVVRENSFVQPPFLVPTSEFGEYRRQVGTSNVSWHNCFDCTKPRGKCTSLKSSSSRDETFGEYDPNDQLYRYRDEDDLRIDIASAASSETAACRQFHMFDPVHMHHMLPSYESVYCETGGTIVLTTMLEIGTDVQMRLLSPARPVVTRIDLHMHHEESDDGSDVGNESPRLSLVVEVTNGGDLSGNFIVQGLPCCFAKGLESNGTACSTSSDMIVGHAKLPSSDSSTIAMTRDLARSENDTVQYDVEYSFEHTPDEMRGIGMMICGVQVSVVKGEDASSELTPPDSSSIEMWAAMVFDAGVKEPPPPPPPPPSPPPQPPAISESVNASQSPLPTTTTTMTTTAAATAVTTSTIPTTTPASEQTTPAPVPPLSQTTSSTTQMVTTTTPTEGSSHASDCSSLSSGMPDCGTHGRRVECTCMCDDGWSTDYSQDLASFLWCTVPSHVSKLSTDREVPVNSTPGVHTDEPGRGKFDAFHSFWPPGRWLTTFVVVATIMMVCCIRRACLRSRASDPLETKGGVNSAPPEYEDVDDDEQILCSDDAILLDMNDVHIEHSAATAA